MAEFDYVSGCCYMQWTVKQGLSTCALQACWNYCMWLKKVHVCTFWALWFVWNITQVIPHKYGQQKIIAVWWKSLSCKHPVFPLPVFFMAEQAKCSWGLFFPLLSCDIFSVTWGSSQAHKVFNKWCLFYCIFLKHPDEKELCNGEQYWPFNDWTVGRMMW